MSVTALASARNGKNDNPGHSAHNTSDLEHFLANRAKHDPLARLAAEYLPPPADQRREPCVRALVVTLRFLPSHQHLREEHLEALRGAICPRNELILEELRVTINQPSGSDPRIRFALRCAYEGREGFGGYARLGTVALMHRLHRLADCFRQN